MRRRGFRGRSGGSGGSVGLGERLREIRELGLRDIRNLEPAAGAPRGIEVASGVIGGTGRALVIAGREPSLELIAWARIGLAMQSASGSVDEVVIAAPSFDGVTRRAAQQLAVDRIPVRLVSVAALAESADGARSVEIFPASHEVPTPGSILDRVVRVIDGAVTITGAGALRRFGASHLVYLRGVCALSVAPEGDGVAVNFIEPEARQVHVTDANFSRWGLELHESVVQLAQDPRLIDRPEHAHDVAAAVAADAAGVRIVARWLPRDVTGRGPASWLGQDAQGVPVVGIVQTRVGVSELAEVIAGLEAAREQLSNWIPSATQPLRLVLITENLDDAARSLLEQLDIDFDTRSLETSPEAGALEARQGRRRRQRRRGRRGGEELEPTRAIEASAESTSEQSGENEDVSREAGEEEASKPRSDRPRRSRRRGRRPEAAEVPESAAPEADESVEAGLVEDTDLAGSGSPEDQEAERRARVERRRARRGRSRPDARADADSSGADASPDVALSLVSDDASAEALPVIDEEIAAAIEVEEDEIVSVDAPEEPPVEKPHRRRSRASICVRDDPDSILAALILSRDRRHISFFYVCSQAGLMDFFRGKATDLEEESDLLMVGFSADPIPRETISMAELFRGRIQWYDSGDWAIEDIEALRAAIGEDSVAIDEAASSPLAPVLESCERRSRFTDKLVDLAARRLSETDMGRWGYRLMGLVSKMATVKGDQRSSVSPVLAGKATEIPNTTPVYEREAEWLEEHDPRMVHFGEYQMAVVSVPEQLDAGEVGRRARLLTGARLSLACRENDNLIIFGSNDEKRYINLTGVVDSISSNIAWARSRDGGDRIGRFEVDGLNEFPERLDTVIGAITQHKSVLYG